MEVEAKYGGGNDHMKIDREGSVGNDSMDIGESSSGQRARH